MSFPRLVYQRKNQFQCDVRGDRLQPLNTDAARVPRRARHQKGRRERQLRRQGPHSIEQITAQVFTFGTAVRSRRADFFSSSDFLEKLTSWDVDFPKKGEPLL